MPLPLPHLDDRRWQDLVEEGRALIPRFASDWTDHNIHDPGIMLIELFAWLTETAIYRLNRVPDRHLRKFLALIGFAIQPPRAARTVISFYPAGGMDQFSVPPGTIFQTVSPGTEPIPFRTLRPLTVSLSKLESVGVDAGDGNILDCTGDWQAGFPWAALGPNPRPGSSLYLGFSSLPLHVPISLGFNFLGPGHDLRERRRITQEIAVHQNFCRKIYPDIRCNGKPEPANQGREEVIPVHHSAQVVWEVLTRTNPATWTCLENITGREQPVEGQVRDDTRSLTLDGMVEINLAAMASTRLGQDKQNLYYLRGRLQRGAYEAPPLLLGLTPNSVEAEQAVSVTQTFTIPLSAALSGTHPTPGQKARFHLQLNHLGHLNALSFVNNAKLPGFLVLDYLAPAPGQAGAITLELTQVAISDGTPGQVVTLPRYPVQTKSMRLYTHKNKTWQKWLPRTDLDASHRGDHHFVLNPETGEVTFGDGARGCSPPAGAIIFAAYRWTQAHAGNLPLGRITGLAQTPHNTLWRQGLQPQQLEQILHLTTNRVPATGGQNSENLVDAIGRAIETLHAPARLLELCDGTDCRTLDQLNQERIRAIATPDRAVNVLDLERLALEVPGTRIARVRAWANFHKDYPCLKMPGVVTLVVVPDSDVPGPEPSAGLLRAVKAYLDRRRLVCTRLEVVGPQYLVVRVQTRLRAKPQVNKTRVKSQVWEALDAFLDPRHGGPQKMGWPFGRDVYRSEVLQVIDAVPGVEHVLELSFCLSGAGPICGNVPVCPTWLVSPGEHHIIVEENL